MKNCGKIRGGGAYKITRFSAANCPRVAHLASSKNPYIGFHLVPGPEDYDKYQLRNEQCCAPQLFFLRFSFLSNVLLILMILKLQKS